MTRIPPNKVPRSLGYRLNVRLYDDESNDAITATQMTDWASRERDMRVVAAGQRSAVGVKARHGRDRCRSLDGCVRSTVSRRGARSPSKLDGRGQVKPASPIAAQDYAA